MGARMLLFVAARAWFPGQLFTQLALKGQRGGGVGNIGIML